MLGRLSGDFTENKLHEQSIRKFESESGVVFLKTVTLTQLEKNCY